MLCVIILYVPLTTHIDGDENPAEMLTKAISSGKRMYLVSIILHDVSNQVNKYSWTQY